MIVGLWLDLVFGVYAPACTRIRCQCHSAHLSNIKCYQSDAASRRVSHHISNGCVTAITSSVYNRRLFPRLNDSASVCDIRITCRDRTCQYKARITHRKQQQQTNSEKSNDNEEEHFAETNICCDGAHPPSSSIYQPSATKLFQSLLRGCGTFCQKTSRKSCNWLFLGNV